MFCSMLPTLMLDHTMTVDNKQKLLSCLADGWAIVRSPLSSVVVTRVVYNDCGGSIVRIGEIEGQPLLQEMPDSAQHIW